MRRVILTADDFGLSPAVNEAVERACRAGALTTASLMVGAEAARDAVERARRLPALRVGLHLVVADGTPISSRAAIPGLVDATGRLSPHLFRAGLRSFLDRGVRGQLELEVRAQFEAFDRTGLPLDHANVHRHLHLHPTVADTMLEAGRDHGLRAVRLPNEPLVPSWRAARKGLVGRTFSRAFLLPWLSLLRAKLRRAGVRSNDFIFGLNDTGRMSLGLVLRILRFLPEGTSEIYFHPASEQLPAPGPAPERLSSQAELDALSDPALRGALDAGGIRVADFGSL